MYKDLGEFTALANRVKEVIEEKFSKAVTETVKRITLEIGGRESERSNEAFAASIWIIGTQVCNEKRREYEEKVINSIKKQLLADNSESPRLQELLDTIEERKREEEKYLKELNEEEDDDLDDLVDIKLTSPTGGDA